MSNILQESIKKSNILTSVSTDHSPIVSKNPETPRGNGLWKFNNYLCSNIDYTTKLKNHIKLIQKTILKENITDEKIFWEYIKYEIRKLSISFCKQYAKDKRTKTFTNDHYLECKNKLEQVYQEKVNGIKIRSKCNWYEFGEKSSKFFLNLEKWHALKNQVRSLLFGQNEITDNNQINSQLHHFYKTLFTEKLQIQNEDITAYLNQISIPVRTEEQSQTCDGPILENELLKALKNMSNNKSPGNDGLTKEFYETFCEDLKKPLCASVTKAFHRGEFLDDRRY